MPTDVELMEASLVAAAEAGIEIRHRLFERFFEAYPGRRATFYNLEASGQRMTDETLQMMFGLAGEEKWVQPLVSELTFTHRNYGALPMEEYRVFIDMTVEELRGDGDEPKLTAESLADRIGESLPGDDDAA